MADAKLQEFDVKIKELKTKAEKAGAEAKVKLNKQIEELQKKQDAARKKLSELKTAGEEAWEALKREMDATLTDIEDFIKNLIPAGE
ncbi:MAG: coiled coil domain-containing protein [Candidatus Lindowbacteria bacterium]|nr:coiled coil domain-containing protein [Candidatus Lindowbacteria bacterium]